MDRTCLAERTMSKEASSVNYQNITERFLYASSFIRNSSWFALCRRLLFAYRLGSLQ